MPLDEPGDTAWNLPPYAVDRHSLAGSAAPQPVATGFEIRLRQDLGWFYLPLVSIFILSGSDF